MRWYPWLRPAFEQLLSQYQSGRGHHALLLHSLPGMGGEALCYALSRWLMCQHPQGAKSCGQCRSCQLMQAGTHPDYLQLAVEKGRSSLGVDAIRQLSDKLASHARQGGARVIWIPDANLLTEAAANALLKTLEEPPENCWFFLATHEPGQLLPTLRSRCLYWHLTPPEPAFAEGWLERECQASLLDIRTALRLCSGAPAAALDLLDGKNWQQRQMLCQALNKAQESSDLLALRSELNDDRAVERLDWLSALLLDAVKWRRGASGAMVNLDQAPLIEKLANRQSDMILHMMLGQILTCRQQLVSVPGINRELLLTEMLLRWERALEPGVIPTLPHL